MPDRAIAAAKQLSDELHARGRRENVRNVVETCILVIVACLAGAILINVVAGRGDNARHSRERKAQIDQVLQLQAKLDAVTDPNGCSARRGASGLAVSIATLENDNRVIHGRTTVPVPTVDTTPCPGEPGGPPLTIVTPTTTKSANKTKTTGRTALAPTVQQRSGVGSGSGR